MKDEKQKYEADKAKEEAAKFKAEVSLFYLEMDEPLCWPCRGLLVPHSTIWCTSPHYFNLSCAPPIFLSNLFKLEEARASVDRRDQQLRELQAAFAELEQHNAELSSRHDRLAAELKTAEAAASEATARAREQRPDAEREHLAAMSVLREEQHRLLSTHKERSQSHLQELESVLAEREEQLAHSRTRAAELEHQLSRLRETSEHTATAETHSAGGANTATPAKNGNGTRTPGSASTAGDDYESSDALSRSSSRMGKASFVCLCFCQCFVSVFVSVHA